MKKLIALVDGSVYAHSVCDHAAWAAQKTGAQVELLHVIGRRQTGPAKTNLSGNITLGARTALLKELSELDTQRAQLSQKIGRAILDDATRHIESKSVEHVTARLRIGDLVETVAEQETEADIVMIGKRGEAADFAKLHLGSNLERIARSSTRPVFVAARALRPVQRFMIAYDGGTSAMKAVDHVARSPLFAGLECVLLMVGADNEENRKRLDNAKVTLEAGSFDVKARILPGQPDSVIATAIEAQGVDLLVMGAYGHSRIRSLIIGSTTSEMIRSCKVPVILFR